MEGSLTPGRQPGADRPVRPLGIPVKRSRTTGDHVRRPGPAPPEHTTAVLREAAADDAEIDRLDRTGALGRAADA